MIQIDYTVRSKDVSFRVLVVDTQKQVSQVVQSVAWMMGDKAMYHPGKDVMAAHLAVFDFPVLIFSKEDLTWETITHECTHLAHTLYEGAEEDIATNTGQLVTMVGKDLKKHGCKILLR